MELTLFCSGLLHIAAALSRGHLMLRTLAVLLSTSVVLVSAACLGAWSPVFLLGSLFLVAYGSLLMPKWYLWALPLTISVAHGAIAWSYSRGVVFRTLDPQLSSSWLRVAVAYLGITGALSYALHHTLSTMKRSRTETRKTLRAATRESLLVEEVIQTIQDAQEQIQEAQEGKEAMDLIVAVRKGVEDAIELVGRTPPQERRTREFSQSVVDSVGATGRVLRELMCPPSSDERTQRDPRLEPATLLTASEESCDESWRNQTLNRGLYLAAIVHTFNAITHFTLSPSPNALESCIGLLWSIVAILLARTERAPGLKAHLLVVAVMLPCAVKLFFDSFTAPVALLGLGFGPILATLYLGHRAPFVAVFCGFATLLLGAWLAPTRVYPDATLLLTDPLNFLRVALLLPLACTLMAMIVVRLVGLVSISLHRLDESLRTLERLRDERMAKQAMLILAEEQASLAREQNTPELPRMSLHDLGNALGALVGWAQFSLRTRQRSDEVLDKAYDSMKEAAERASAYLPELEQWGVRSK